MTSPIPVAVVGAGNMGANHIRVYDNLPGAELVEVVEQDPERAASIRSNYDVSVFEEVSDIERAEAATVAVPNRYHQDIATTLTEMGLDVLVEKPLAMNVADADAIIDAANKHDAVLQVGHIERFNPAIQALSNLLDGEELIALEAHRLGPFNEQLSTESVVFDLMIHDIDIIESLVSKPLRHIDAVGVAPRSELVDHANASLKYGDGVLGTVTASHVTHGKIRTLTATTEDAYIKLDYQDQSITIQRRGSEETTLLSSGTGYRTETLVETPFVKTREPLKKELEHFLDRVRDRETPLVDGERGRRAVELATEIAALISNE